MKGWGEWGWHTDAPLVITPPLNPTITTTLPAPPSLLYVPQSSCLTNWCFFFTAIWSCPCCADGKLSGKCYFIPQLNCFFFVLFFYFSHFCFPLIRAPMLHRLTILSVLVLILLLVYYHAYVLLLEHCHFVCFQFFLTLWFTPCDLDAHCFCVVPFFSTGMGNVEVLSLCFKIGDSLGWL